MDQVRLIRVFSLAIIQLSWAVVVGVIAQIQEINKKLVGTEVIPEKIVLNSR